MERQNQSVDLTFLKSHRTGRKLDHDSTQHLLMPSPLDVTDHPYHLECSLQISYFGSASTSSHSSTVPFKARWLSLVQSPQGWTSHVALIIWVVLLTKYHISWEFINSSVGETCTSHRMEQQNGIFNFCLKQSNSNVQYNNFQPIDLQETRNI